MEINRYKRNGYGKAHGSNEPADREKPQISVELSKIFERSFKHLKNIYLANEKKRKNPHYVRVLSENIYKFIYYPVIEASFLRESVIYISGMSALPQYFKTVSKCFLASFVRPSL